MTGAVGIVGTGHLATWLVAGLRLAAPGLDIVVSPRNRERAAGLRDRHGVRIAPDNAGVVDDSAIVVVATRPPDAAAAVRGLPWRHRQTAVSVAAGVPAARLAPLVAPARLVRAMPVSCAALGISPTAIWPDDADARSLFARVGTVHALPDEEAFVAASVGGAVYGWAFALMDELAGWQVQAGVPPDAARALVALTLRGAATVAMDRFDEPLPDILAGLATPGGITGSGLRRLADSEALAAWSGACAAALARMRDDQVRR